jgi:PDZ domain-containing protein
MLQDGSSPDSRLRFLGISGAVVILLVGGLVGILKVNADRYFVLSPGNAPVVTASGQCRPAGGGSFELPDGQACVKLIVPPDRVHPVQGTILMVDVYEGPANPWQFLLHKLGLYDKHAVFVRSSAVVQGSAAQLECQNTQEAVQATSAAPVAALRQLGYTVKEEDQGAQIDVVYPNTPAAVAGLRCNDLITAINGHTVRTAEDVSSQLHGLPAGTVVRVTARRGGDGSPTRTLQVDVRLAPFPGQKGQLPDPKHGYMGIVTETRTTYDFPFPVSAQVGSIGGPSDGLALALGFVDALSAGRLTGGLRVAATGQIDAAGNVIEIGGAAQKSVAVRKAGAQVFLVPEANYKDARSTAGPLKVIAVSTLSQALAELKSLGGTVPPASHTTTAAPG